MIATKPCKLSVVLWSALVAGGLGCTTGGAGGPADAASDTGRSPGDCGACSRDDAAQDAAGLDGASPDAAGPGGVPWAGIIDPARAIDWSHAGVIGGIPSRTTICATLNPGATAAQINAAIQTCPSGQVVSLTAGTYRIADDGVVLKSGVTLRGAGADQTQLIFTTTNGCNGGQAAICFAGQFPYGGDDRAQPGGSNAADWTAGYARGGTEITLENVGSAGLSVGQYIHLDQANDPSQGPGFVVCDSTAASCSLEGGNGGRTIHGALRSQVQIVQITAINGNRYTISPGLYAPNWRSERSPGAWWSDGVIHDTGVEDLSVDATNAGGQANVFMFNAVNTWVKGTRMVRTCTCSRDLISLTDTAHATVESNYLYGTVGQSINYGQESYTVSDILVQNNIFQHVVAPMMVQPSSGSVYAYNYAINDTYSDSFGIHWMAAMADQHNAGVEFNLYEGNIGPGWGGDCIHGSQLMNTIFRNYFLGSDPGRMDSTTAVKMESFVRYHNLVGNVLGTPGYTTTYQVTAGAGQSRTVYNLGNGNSAGGVTVPNDPQVIATLLRWGNCDTAMGACRFEASEVPSGISPFGNPVPASHALPASFYLATRPSWWPAAKPWPAIGPDVTGGNLDGLNGHVYTSPAEDCYRNVMHGPVDGSGGVLSFNAGSCYGR